MIQFNLLPDVKLEYIKARRSKRMVLMIATGVTGASLLIFIGMFMVVNVLQPKHISDLNKDIAKDTATLKAIPDVNKILTVQNQLTSLTALHDQKPISSRTITYLEQLTPAKATIGDTKVDFAAHTITLTGGADALSTVNKFVDTLKFTDYTVAGQTDAKRAFSDVVLTSFSTGEKGVTYQLSFSFDPVIFDGTKQVTLVVPKIISTRSETEKPSDVFQTTNPAKP